MVSYIENKDYEVSNEERWKYNGRDCYFTLQILKQQLTLLETRSPALQDFYNFQIAEIAPAMVAVMQKGIRIDTQLKQENIVIFSELLTKIELMFNDILSQPFNIKSSQQVKSLFKDLLQVEPEINKKTRTESFGAAALLVYVEKYPLFTPLFKLLSEYKSIGVFVRNFLLMQLDVDQRMRCSYNIAGTDTYRMASRKNAFGTGGNCQNLPSKGKIDIRYANQEVASDSEDVSEFDSSYTSVEGIMKLPNIKKMFLPDIGYVFFDIDYSSADAQFVAWDSDCDFLKKIFKARQDLYSIIASHYYQREIVKEDRERQIFKQVVHATNYLGKAGMIASLTGLSVGLVLQVQDWYLKQCPEVKEWHKMVESAIRQGYPVSNIWGAEGWFTDFNDHNIINKAVAWLPQSSVGILVNKGIVRTIKGEFTRVDSSLDNTSIRSLLTDACNNQIVCPTSILGQTHDSAWGQFDEKDTDAPSRLVGYMELVIPYKDELIIPAGIKMSNKSYGDC